MNRPFYWQYVEATKAEPNPSRLHLITNRNMIGKGTMGEIIHFGSPRLHHIFRATKDLGSFVQMYEKIEKQDSYKTLTPWLCINYKVSYQCDHTKEQMFSFGLNLINGAMESEFHEHILNLELTNERLTEVYCIPPIIKPSRGLERLDETIQNIILQDDHSWAEEAKKRWDKELELLNHFYKDVEDKPERYEIEKNMLKERYNPKIQVEIINGGLFYLK